MSRWSTKSHTFVYVCGEFTHTLEGLARLMMLSLQRIERSGDRTKKDEDKLKYLTTAMATSKSSRKSTYMTWFWFYDECMATNMATSWSLPILLAFTVHAAE